MYYTLYYCIIEIGIILTNGFVFKFDNIFQLLYNNMKAIFFFNINKNVES